MKNSKRRILIGGLVTAMLFGNIIIIFADTSANSLTKVKYYKQWSNSGSFFDF